VKRLFWLALGAVVGVLVVRRLTAAVDTLTPAGLADSLGDLGEAVRDFAADVRVGMAHREAELRAALGIDGPSPNGETPARSGGEVR
jgi:hypothetical protein